MGDPSNSAFITDNVGGDIAGMDADLFSSLVESTWAAWGIATAAVHAKDDGSLPAAGWDVLLLPLMLSAAGIFVRILCSFVAAAIFPAKAPPDSEQVMEVQTVLTAASALLRIFLIATQVLPDEFALVRVGPAGFVKCTPTYALYCAALNTVGGLIMCLHVVLNELFIIMTSRWQRQFYYLLGCLLFVDALAILLVACVGTSLAVTYLQLTSEGDICWLRAWFSSTLPAVYVFLYSSEAA